jgi:hypothetical protein
MAADANRTAESLRGMSAARLNSRGIQAAPTGLFAAMRK